jgi:hypothetical protein
MIGVREFPPITTEDLIGLNFTDRPAELPITTIYGHPSAAFLHSITHGMKAAIERAVCDLGFRYGVIAADLAWKGAALIVRVRYRGRA